MIQAAASGNRNREVNQTSFTIDLQEVQMIFAAATERLQTRWKFREPDYASKQSYIYVPRYEQPDYNACVITRNLHFLSRRRVSLLVYT